MSSRLLHHWVAERAQARPESAAVVSGATRLSYGELDTLSTQIARLLRQGGCQRFDRVALLMASSPLAIAGLYGIGKADGVYVPLDSASPVSRLRKILDSCDNRWLLAGGPVVPVLRELLQDEACRKRLRIGWLDRAAAVPDDIRVDFTLEDIVSC